MSTTPKTAMRKGMRVIITGASTGIGKAMAIQLGKEYNAKIIMNARGGEDLQKAADEVRKAGGEVKCVVGDVSNDAVCNEMISSCQSDFGGIDALVNNAGLARSGPMTGLTLEDWRYVFEVNFFAALNLTYKALPSFMDQGFGKVVNIASVAGKVSFPGSICYASSKFALTGFSEGMAAEFAGKFDTITVCPGWVRTEFFKRNNTAEDPSAIAERKDLKGWLMKNMLSISSEQASDDTIKAMKRGGSHELVLTAPGIVVERMSGFFPELTMYLTSLVPAERKTRK